jgi:hypothetical protein
LNPAATSTICVLNISVICLAKRRKFMSIPEKEDPSPEFEADEARAGVTGHHVRVVLAVGLLGAIAGLMLIAFWH